ncbi:hypothetical protein D3C71_1534460 [compost metagenome]
MDLAVNDREDHCVIFGLDILLQQGHFGSGPQCRFLAGDELLAQRRCLVNIGWMKKSLDTGLILRADIQLATQGQELTDGHGKGRDLVRAGCGRLDQETRFAMEGPLLALVSFEVMQRSL